jgi:hypothetical protein
MPYASIFGFGDNQPTFVNATMWAGMMWKPEFITLGADSQLRQGDVIMGTPHIFFGRRSTPFW